MLTANRNMVFRGVTVSVGDAFDFELTDIQYKNLIENGYIYNVVAPADFAEATLENGVEDLDPEKTFKKGGRK